MATRTWSPAADSSWSVDASWSGGTKPAAGDAVVFDATSVKNCSIDEDTAALLTFSVNSGYSGVITNAANCDVTTTSDITISAGTVTSVTTAVWTCGGSFLKTGGTVAAWLMKMVFTKDGGTINVGSAQTSFYSVQYSNNITVTATVALAHQIIIVDSGKTVTLNSGSNFAWWAGYTASSFSNAGTIAGAGTLTLYGGGDQNTQNTIIFGTVNCPVIITNPTTYNYIWNLGANAVLGSTLNVVYQAGTTTVTLSHGSDYQLQVAGLTTLGTRGVMTQGTGTWTFTGGYTQSGASSVFTQGGNITTGAITMTAGTFTANSAYTTSCSDNVTIAAGVISSWTFNLTVTGLNKTVACNCSMRLFTVNDDTSLITSNLSCGSNGGGLTIASGKTLTITTIVLTYYNYSTAAFTNAGTISGTGSLFIMATTGTKTDTFGGTINVPVTMGIAVSGGTHTLSLGANTIFGSTLTINNNAQGTNTFTLSHGTNYTLTVTGLTTLGAYGVMTQGTGTWTFTGGFTQSGTSSVFTMGGNVTCSADCTISDGTFTPNGTYTWTCAGNFNSSVSIGVQVLKLDMITDGKTIVALSGWFKTITATGNTSIITNNQSTLNVATVAGKTLTLTKSLTLENFLAANFDNQGAIVGLLVLKYYNSTPQTLPALGNVVGANISMFNGPSSSVNLVLNMSESISCAILSVYSSHATNTMTLNHVSNYTLTCSGLCTVGALTTLTQGTGTWTFSGGLTINGTGALFTQAGAVSTAGNFALTSGTFTASAGIFTFNKTSLQTITGAPVFATIATSGSGTKVEGSFSATTVTTVAGTYIIATTWAGTANDYRIYVHTGESLNKSTITTDFSSSSNVTLKRGSFACNETAAANSIVIDSGTTFTNNAGITLTCCSITNNGTFINNGIISCGISYPSYIIDVTNMIDNAHMIDATNWRRIFYYNGNLSE